MYSEILEKVREMVGKGQKVCIHFDTALEVKPTPHTPPVYLWGVSVSPKNVLLVMDGDQEWWPVEPNDPLVIPSLYQRVLIIYKQVA
jgi:hypothetical protein